MLSLRSFSSRVSNRHSRAPVVAWKADTAPAESIV